MDDRSLKSLEFYHLTDILKEYSISPLGRKRCEALRPSKDLPLIQSRLAEVIELKKVFDTEGEIPLRGLKDIEIIFQKLEVEGSVLDVRELLDLYEQVVLCRALRRFFERLENVRAPRLQEKISRLSYQKALEKEILQAVNIKGEILDRASPALLDIRHRLGGAREKAKGVLESLLHQEYLQSIFQEQLITIRNGRYVLPIKSDAERRLDGIIHDHSQSRMTYFLEPFQVVPLNNEINLLMGEEKEEEYRILADLSDKVRGQRLNLLNDFEILGELDLLYAMAKLSIRLKGVSPLLNENGQIEMREARNPLLTLQRETQVVPIHLRMGDGHRILIVSGANAGGKTVALKTLGLLTLMVQSGLPIPVAEGSQVGIFQDIFAVIGDEQNIEENLSTFSSHLLHVNQILEKAGPHSLILLDELGVGTHAQEGCALAMGFLDRFREKGASVVVTTHFDRLKTYGYLHPDVENVSVEFDEKTLEPKYRLAYGSSGLSNAFLIAEKLGISAEVLEAARRHQDGSDEEVRQALASLERLKRDAERERLAALKMKEEIGLERERLKKIVETIRERRLEIHAKAEEKARKAIQKVEEELREWVRLRKEEKSPPSLRHKELQEIKDKLLPSFRKKGPSAIQGGLKVGERVRIESLRSDGILTNVVKPLNRAEVVTDKAKVTAPLSEIVQVEEEKGKEETAQKSQVFLKGTASTSTREPSSQLNVIGLSVEDALSQVDKFIDQALLHGLEKVQIIHGVGSGRLRSAIGQYLKEHRAVKSFSPGETLKGGRGITIVELR
ncbi:MAG: endonuclease MutS2 [Thermodesulfobacteriota bacterium]